MARPSLTFSARRTGPCILRRARLKRETFTSSLDSRATSRRPVFLFAPRTSLPRLTVESFHDHRTRRPTVVGEFHHSDSAACVVLVASRRRGRHGAAVSNQWCVRGGVRIPGSYSRRLSARSHWTAPRISGNALGRCSHVRTVLRSIPSDYAIPEESSHARSPARSRYNRYVVHRCFAHFRQLQGSRRRFPLDLRHLGHRVLRGSLVDGALAPFGQGSGCALPDSSSLAFVGVVSPSGERSRHNRRSLLPRVTA